jgi:hypothetical protein
MSVEPKPTSVRCTMKVTPKRAETNRRLRDKVAKLEARLAVPCGRCDDRGATINRLVAERDDLRASASREAAEAERLDGAVDFAKGEAVEMRESRDEARRSLVRALEENIALRAEQDAVMRREERISALVGSLQGALRDLWRAQSDGPASQERVVRGRIETILRAMEAR